MLRRVRNLPLVSKSVILLIVVVIVGLAIGGQQSTAIAGLAFLILAGIVLWRVISRVVRLFRKGSRTKVAGQRLDTLPIQVPNTNPMPPAGWAPPLHRHIHSPGIGDVLALTPGQFEDMTAALLDSLGFTAVQRTGKAGDLGADITCRDPQGRTSIVQCKRYAPGSTIGTPVVQTFIGMMSVHHRVERGLIVTTVHFTQQAVDLARHHGVALIDGPALLLLLHLTGIPLYRQAESYPG